MLKPRHWLLALIVSLPCFMLLADDDDAPGARENARDVEVVWQRWGQPEESGPAILDEPLRLEFQIDAGEGHRFDVTCASEEYRISIDLGDQNQEHHVEVEGRVQPLDDGDRLFVSFNTTILNSNLAEGGEVTFSAEGSTIVIPGQRSRLVTFPGPSMSLTVSPVE